MKTKHLGILTGLAVAFAASAAPRSALAVCDSCLSHALPTQTTYYAPAAVATTAYYPTTAYATTAYYAPATPAYTTYYRPRWFQSWWRAPRTSYYSYPAYSYPVAAASQAAYYPTTANATTAYYAPAAVAAPACSTCVQQVNYVPQTSYKVQIVNKPVTTMQPTTIVDSCTGCAQTVLRPVTTYVQEQQYVPTTVYRPVVSGCCETGCATPCTSCATGYATESTGCASCVGAAATIQTVPATEQQSTGVPTEAEQKPELRMKPLPDKEANEPENKAKKATGNSFPRLADPNDKTAQRPTNAVRQVSWEQAAPAKGLTNRQVGDGGWVSAK
jgi:hypothetical protein